MQIGTYNEDPHGTSATYTSMKQTVIFVSMPVSSGSSQKQDMFSQLWTMHSLIRGFVGLSTAKDNQPIKEKPVSHGKPNQLKSVSHGKTNNQLETEIIGLLLNAH